MRTALVLSFTNLHTDPRVLRQLQWLAPTWRVTAAGHTNPKIPGVAFVHVYNDYDARLRAKIGRGVELLARCFERVYWAATQTAYATLHQKPHELIVANDSETWPLAVRLAQQWNAKIVMDAHEYSPRQFEDRWKWRLLRQRYETYLCTKYLPQAHGLCTVAQHIANTYQQLLGRPFTVITNAPEYHPDLTPQPYVAGTPIRIVHHGAANTARRIEVMLDMATMLEERFETSFLLVGDPKYRAWLQQRVAGHPRIHFLPPVPTEQLPSYLNQYDLGLFLLPPTTFNYAHALPNKFFEFIQARLGILIGPSPEMAHLVQHIGNGIVASDFQPATLAKLINALTPADINRLKQASHTAAHEYTAEDNRTRFLELCDRV